MNVTMSERLNSIVKNAKIADVPYECEHCGQLVSTVHTVKTATGTEFWCSECRDTDASLCDHCDTWHEDGLVSVVHMDDGSEEAWCDECLESGAHWCEQCETWHESTSPVIVGGTYWSRGGYLYESWCDDCVDYHAVKCEDCENIFAMDCDAIDSYYVWGSGNVCLCEACVDDNYYTCCDCGDLVHSDDVEFDAYDDHYCPDCIGEHRGNVHSYGHTYGELFWLGNDLKKFAWSMSAEERRRLFLGIELETDGNDDRNDLADDIASEYDNDFVVCKEDGSLHNQGLEIVSLPMTPEVHLTSGMWERIAEIVLDHGGTSHDAGTCGLHIHLSREFFDDHDAVYRLDRLFHRFEPQMIRFSRRTSDGMRWCVIGGDDLHEIPDVHERKKKWADKKARAGRYEAVNDTNSATVEIRLWRGTLNMETFRATVEFTTGLALIANNMTDEFADQLTWSMVKVLVKFALEEHGLPHDDLDAYLVRRGL